MLLHSYAFRASGIAERINVLDKAFVPIVKMVDKDTKIFLDISFNTVQGVRAAKYIEQMKSRYPVLEPLVLILKQFLMQRQLNQVSASRISLIVRFYEIAVATSCFPLHRAVGFKSGIAEGKSR